MIKEKYLSLIHRLLGDSEIVHSTFTDLLVRIGRGDIEEDEILFFLRTKVVSKCDYISEQIESVTMEKNENAQEKDEML